MDKRRMCPNCRAFITTDDKVCPYCEAKVEPRAVDRRAASDSDGWLSAGRFTTTILLLINVGLYVATSLYSMNTREGSFLDLDGQTLYNFGAKFSPVIFQGEYWRLVTAGFLHGGIFHLAMNSWALYDLGARVEEAYGTARYVVFYFASTVAGFLASTYWSPSLSVGSSAGVFGLIGVMIAMSSGSQSGYAQAVRGHYMQWAVYGLVIGFIPGFHIDNAAHIGGLAAGFVAAYFIGIPKLLQDWRTKMWRVAAALCVLITAGCFGIMFLGLAS